MNTAKITRSIRNMIRTTTIPVLELERIAHELELIRSYSFSSESIKEYIRSILYGVDTNDKNHLYNGLDLILEFKYHLALNEIDVFQFKFIEEQFQLIKGMSLFEQRSEGGEIMNPLQSYSNYKLGENEKLDQIVTLVYVLKMHIKFLKTEIKNLKDEKNEHQINIVRS